MRTKQRVVTALLRVYPAAWRAEYGPELTDILLTRPLSLSVIVDVLWSGLGHRAQAVEPSTILGLASMSVVLTGFVPAGGPYGRNWMAVLQPTSMTFPPVTVTFLGTELYVLLLIGCGCWTHLRYGGKVSRSGVAAMTMSLLAGLPVMVGGVLVICGVFSVKFLGPDLPTLSPAAIQISPLARLPEFWIWGALGGLLGQWIARRRPDAGAGVIRP